MIKGILKFLQRQANLREYGVENPIILNGDMFINLNNQAFVREDVKEKLDRLLSASEFFSQDGISQEASKYAHESNRRLLKEILDGTL